MAQRRFTHTSLAVDLDLEGRSLPSPFRRVLAFLIDCVVLLIPSMMMTVMVAWLSLSVTAPDNLETLKRFLTSGTGWSDREERLQALEALSPLLVEIDAEGLPPAAHLAVKEGDLRKAAEIIDEMSFVLSLSPDNERQELGEGMIRVEIIRFIPPWARAAASLGTAALYFTLLAAGRRRTLGKMILGLRTVRLDGHPLTVWQSFERFATYLASAGTIGLGLLDLWRDPNRRLAHDRVAHTVVLRK